MGSRKSRRSHSKELAARTPQSPTPTNHSLRARSVGQDTTFEAEFYSGVIPHPDLMAKWEVLVPGAAERILAMTEEQSRHRQSLETTAIPQTLLVQRRGQHYGLIVALGGLSASSICAVVHEGGAAMTVGGGTLAVMVTTFVKGHQGQTRERAQQRARIR